MLPNWTGWTSIKAFLFSLVTLNGVFLTADVFSPGTVKDAHIAALFLGAAGVIVTTLSGSGASTPALLKTAAAKAARVAVALLMLVGVGRALSACSSTQKTQEETLGVDLALCTLQHYGEPAPQIVIECGAASLEDVQKILDAKAAADARGISDAGHP